MVINIITGNSFSQRKLFLSTNKYFNKTKNKDLITSRNDNYIVQIQKKSIKIILSDNHNIQDINKVKSFIETLFEDQSILIDSTCDLSWIKDIKKVKINLI